jgi:glutamate mutase epsilon subunit
MAIIEFTKKYADGRIVSVSYENNPKYYEAGPSNKRDAIKMEKKHQDIKYYNALQTASEEEALEAYIELCKTLEWN